MIKINVFAWIIVAGAALLTAAGCSSSRQDAAVQTGPGGLHLSTAAIPAAQLKAGESHYAQLKNKWASQKTPGN